MTSFPRPPGQSEHSQQSTRRIRTNLVVTSPEILLEAKQVEYLETLNTFTRKKKKVSSGEH